MEQQIKEIKYQTTKEECQHRIDVNGFVCQQCGGKLIPIKTVDNADQPTFWSGCEPCCIYTHGVTTLVYQIAKDMVVNQNYVHYRESIVAIGKTEEEKKYWLDSQIGGATNVVHQVLRTYKRLTAI